MLDPASIVISGASSGIGRALALAYAAPGRRLGLIARNRARLDAVAAECVARGAEAVTGALDVGDRGAVERWLLAYDDAAPIDLVVANAGVHSGANAEQRLEPLHDALEAVRVNLVGAMHTVDPALRRMRERRRGHVALMSSLAAIRGFYCAPAYAATKAALRGYGDSLRGLVARDGIVVSVIHPGFVETPLDDRVQGAKYRRMGAERAARIIKRGLDRRRPIIAFPRELHLGLVLLGLLPARWADAIMRAHRFGVDGTDAGR